MPHLCTTLEPLVCCGCCSTNSHHNSPPGTGKNHEKSQDIYIIGESPLKTPQQTYDEFPRIIVDPPSTPSVSTNHLDQSISEGSNGADDSISSRQPQPETSNEILDSDSGSVAFVDCPEYPQSSFYYGRTAVTCGKYSILMRHTVICAHNSDRS
ncbi:hypothetical protein AB6A40_011407 [Gnathostoma spinigerum]|uniref:Uncharacterized protein n=1 Tax=Gnathostoma spinigerum TaxID=75299 RepID=A0ABD6EXJ9_9BILA